MSDIQQAKQTEAGAEDMSNFDGVALAKLFSRVKEGRNGGKVVSVRELLNKIKERAPLETMTPALETYATQITEAMRALQRKMDEYIQAEDQLRKLVKQNAPFAAQQTQATLVEKLQAEVGQAKNVAFDFMNHDGVDGKSIAKWKDSAGGKKLMELARSLSFDVVQITRKGAGAEGKDAITLDVRFGETPGKGRLKKETIRNEAEAAPGAVRA